jgi:Uma2 family endonuclease
MATADTTHLDDDDMLVNGIRRPTGPMTEEEFLAWCDEDVRAEWVDGEVIIMSPSSLKHVRIINWLCAVMGLYVKARGLGEVLTTDYLVHLDGRRVMRLPDVMFIANEHLDRLKPTYLEGPPDLAVEVVSPDSQERDREDKFADYQAAGVREYWIIDPDEDELLVYRLGSDGRYAEVAPAGDRVESAVIPGFYLRAEWLRETPLPDEWATLRALGCPGG